ncbi:ketose-bisphosphate aldolase class-ii-like protein [Phlyctema vagabunda]|uniref:Ketose-bisphosphate aldolase class-ii-like protein n=1 Tax=Phlyctema vagabunda TaxID=108571 RepID=A0ABR4PLF5_9HELO
MTSFKGEIAFIGLGAMGFGMATHLVSAGYSVTGYDVWAPTLEKFTAAGGKAATTPREAARGKSVLIFMVATGAQTMTALFDKTDGAIHELPQKATIIHCSTAPPEHVPEMRALLDGEFGRKDVELVDAPVSGGTIRAAAGALTILASGPESSLKAGNEYLEEMAGGFLAIIPGGLGAGTKVKMVHQVLAGIHITMASEAMGFAAALGLNTKETYEALKGSEGESWMLMNRGPHMIVEDPKVYSALNIITKDVGIVAVAGRKEKFPLFLSSATEHVLAVGVRWGLGLIDDAQLTRAYLPQEQDLVLKQAADSFVAQEKETKFRLVRSVLSAVHVAAAAEAMSFGAKVGLDTKTLFDIIKSAAGSSIMFVERVPQILSGKWEPAKGTVEKQISALVEALDEAAKIKYPLHLAGAALQIFQLAAIQGLSDQSDVSIVKIWEGTDGPYFPQN